jgi:hypothetical protein
MTTKLLAILMTLVLSAPIAFANTLEHVATMKVASGRANDVEITVGAVAGSTVKIGDDEHEFAAGALTHKFSVSEASLSTINISATDKNSITSLDVSSNDLTNLNVAGNRALATLNVAGNSTLMTLDCSNAALKSLDVSALSRLEVLVFHDNPLVTLNASGTALANLDVSDIKSLTSLNVTGCNALGKLDCSNTGLTTLNVSGLSALYELECSYTPLKFLNVSGCTDLERLDCNNTSLESLDVSNLSKLWTLNCSKSALKSLNISECRDLAFLFADGQEVSFDVPFDYNDTGVNISFNGDPYPFIGESFSIPTGVVMGNGFKGNITINREADTRPRYTVAFAALDGVSVDKGASGEVIDGEDFSFTVTVADEFANHKLVVFVNGRILESASNDNVYTIKSVNRDIEVRFLLALEFTPIVYHNVSIVTMNGITLDQSRASRVEDGDSFTFTVTIDPVYVDYELKVLVNGEELKSLSNNNTYTIDNVDSDKLINLTLERKAGNPTDNTPTSVASVSTTYGEITVETPSAAIVQITNIGGRVAFYGKASGTTRVSVSAGIYVVTINGKSVKVIVR